MLSLISYLYNHIEKIIAGILLITALGCSNQINSATAVSPKKFKVQVPFIQSARGILVNTYWGTGKKHRVLCLDNYSPPWIKNSVIQYDKSFTKYKDNNFNTSTGDGTRIQGEIGICDSLAFENIVFTNTAFYLMPNNAIDNANDDGVFGFELISKGIWKIDFKKSELTFTSDIDSLPGIAETEIFPSVFDEQSIKIDVRFGNNVAKTMAVDWGFNGDLLLPAEDFSEISVSKKIFSEPVRFSTPASRKIINSSSILDTIYINHNWFRAFVSSGETVKERLIGLLFFRRFDYVIFDFINKKIHVPKKVW